VRAPTGPARGRGWIGLAWWCTWGVVFALAGCSTEQVYNTGQAWKRNTCYQINDAQERGRCLASTSASHEDYQREAEAARGAR
jgi:hypothetical protein